MLGGQDEVAVAVAVHVGPGHGGGQSVPAGFTIGRKVGFADGDLSAPRAAAGGAVAVVVEAVSAHLHRPRIHGGVGIVAVAGNVGQVGQIAGQDADAVVAVPVAIQVRVALDGVNNVWIIGIDEPVAVVVHAVANLGGAGAHVRIGVVAVFAAQFAG